MTDPQKHRKQWIAMLAKLVAPMETIAAGKAMSEMLPMLEDFPDGAFTIASLHAVAAATKRVPTYGELRTSLGAWWSANRPEEPSAVERPAWLERYAKERADAKASWSDPANVRESRDVVLSSDVQQHRLGRMLAALVNRHCPANIGLLPAEWHPA